MVRFLYFVILEIDKTITAELSDQKQVKNKFGQQNLHIFLKIIMQIYAESANKILILRGSTSALFNMCFRIFQFLFISKCLKEAK